MEQKEKSVLTERKKIFTRCIAIISVAAAVLIIMLPYKQDNSTAAYEELLSEELNLYEIKNKDGSVSYVLSNLQKDAEYAVNNVNSENVSEYLYIVADDE